MDYFDVADNNADVVENDNEEEEENWIELDGFEEMDALEEVDAVGEEVDAVCDSWVTLDEVGDGTEQVGDKAEDTVGTNDASQRVRAPPKPKITTDYQRLSTLLCKMGEQKNLLIAYNARLRKDWAKAHKDMQAAMKHLEEQIAKSKEVWRTEVDTYNQFITLTENLHNEMASSAKEITKTQGKSDKRTSNTWGKICKQLESVQADMDTSLRWLSNVDHGSVDNVHALASCIEQIKFFHNFESPSRQRKVLNRYGNTLKCSIKFVRDAFVNSKRNSSGQIYARQLHNSPEKRNKGAVGGMNTTHSPNYISSRFFTRSKTNADIYEEKGDDQPMQKHARQEQHDKSKGIFFGEKPHLPLNKESLELQLDTIAADIKQDIDANGSTHELQRMLRESETLLGMSRYKMDDGQLRQRFYSLKSVFDNHFKINHQGTSTDIEGDRVLRNVRSRMSPSVEASSDDRTELSVAPKSSLLQLTSFSPKPPGDLYNPRISSLLTIGTKSLVMVDMVNSCLKHFDIPAIMDNDEFSFFRSMLEMRQPFYVCEYMDNQLLVTKADQMIALVALDESLRLLQMYPCNKQYYGIGWVRSNEVACVSGESYHYSAIDLLSVSPFGVRVTKSFNVNCHGLELLTITPHRNMVCIHKQHAGKVFLSAMGHNGSTVFVKRLRSSVRDTWNVTCFRNMVYCINKNTNKVVVYQAGNGKFVEMIKVPENTVRNPFAMCFGKNGDMFVADDVQNNNPTNINMISVFRIDSK